MSKKRRIYIGLAVIIVVCSVFYFRSPESGDQPPVVTGTPDTGLSYLKLSDNLEISVFAQDIKNSRVIVFDLVGRMLVSQPAEGKVVKIEDIDKDGKADQTAVILTGLNKPHGLAFFTDATTTYLYVAETDKVSRYVYDAKQGKVGSSAGENITSLPADGRHFTRTINFGPNYRTGSLVGGLGLSPIKLYISVGSSCDACVENTTWKRAAILESDPAGSYTAEFAGGLRNSVFFTFHPKTKEIWATEMGRDNLGDNLPPDEVNIVKVAGPEHEFGARRYGWPFCYGNQIKDKKFNPGEITRKDLSPDCTKTESPAIEIPAHSAPLGLAFIPSGSGWPKEWENDLLVALHGSWDSSVPVGYSIVRYDLDENGKVLSREPADFISGWFSGGEVKGRPVDLKFGTDGYLYISDDIAGVIYSVKPNKKL